MNWPPLVACVFLLPAAALAAEPAANAVAAARATIELREAELGEAYTAARQAFDPERKIHDLRKIQRREELGELADQLRNLRATDAAMRDALLEADERYRQELTRRGVAEATAATLAEAFYAESSRQQQTIYSESLRELQGAYFETMQELLDLAGAHFKAWQTAPPPYLSRTAAAFPPFRFHAEEANVRYRELFQRVTAIAREQERLTTGTAIAVLSVDEQRRRKAAENTTIKEISIPEGQPLKNEEELRKRGVKITRTPRESPTIPPRLRSPLPPSRPAVTYAASQPDLNMVGPQLADAIAAAPRARFGTDPAERPPTPYSLFRTGDSTRHFVFPAKSSPPVLIPGDEILLSGYFGAPPQVIPFQTLAEGSHDMGNIDLTLVGEHRELISSEIESIDAPAVKGIRLRVEGAEGIVVTLPRDLPAGDYALVIAGSIHFRTPLVYDFEVKAVLVPENRD